MGRECKLAVEWAHGGGLLVLSLTVTLLVVKFNMQRYRSDRPVISSCMKGGEIIQMKSCVTGNSKYASHFPAWVGHF